MSNKLRAVLVECSDIMLNGIFLKIADSDDVEITGKIPGIEHIEELNSSDENDIILIGPMFCDIYGAEFCDKVFSKFPGKKAISLSYEDYPSNIISRIKEFSNGVEV